MSRAFARTALTVLGLTLCACAPGPGLPPGVAPGDPETFRKAVAAVGCRVSDPATARAVEDLTGQSAARLGAVAGYLAGQGELQRIPGGFVLISGSCATLAPDPVDRSRAEG